jgi:hypothetical protein
LLSPLLSKFCPNIACQTCDLSIQRTIRLRFEGFKAMPRTTGVVSGFSTPAAPSVRRRVSDAIAAGLALGALSLSLVVTITVLSIKVSMAMPCLP